MSPSESAHGFGERPVEELSVLTLRTLVMDAVQQADSGHPGTPMALAPVAYLLYRRLMRHNPRNPQWFNRDRFILSAGHASMLQYAVLHLTGYDLSLDDIRQFRQWGSKTPGHPEFGLTPGVETTTGPLGQGLMNAVGMALAEAHLADRFNRDGFPVVDHHTYVICSDGDMMEGASHEAAAVAGHLGLGKLIVLYDDNHITIDGATDLSFSDDVAGRFAACHWHVQDLGEQAEDLDALEAAYAAAREESGRPSLIILRSHIAHGAPHSQDTSEAHGSPLGEEEVRATKQRYGWPPDAHFLVPERVREHMQGVIREGERQEQDWSTLMDRYREAHPESAALLESAMADELPPGWDEHLPLFEGTESKIATRKAAGEALNHFAARIPWLIGGAADLASSTKASIAEGGDVRKGDWGHRNLHWGVREHVMAAAASGMALHGGVRPFASTFLIFTDYARPALRLAALMGQPVVYALSHDSIGLGEDGPTHQPVEHLASFRAMPNCCVIRPADANEAVQAWRAALARQDGPTLLVLSRQKLPVLDRDRLAGAEGVPRGAYVLSPQRGETPDAILLASGSEVALALGAQGRLWIDHEIDARVVSMPSWELFREQSGDYRDTVLPPRVTCRLAVEAAAPTGWCEWVGGRGGVMGIETFGASAPGEINMARYGFTVDNVVARVRALVNQTIHSQEESP